MKNKGFTLVELLVVLALLAVLAIIIGTNINGLQGKQSDKNYNNFKSQVESAACTFIENNTYTDGAITISKNYCRQQGNNGCLIPINRIVSAGLLDATLVNPSTETVVDQTKVVKIYWDNDGKKICEYQE